MPVGSLMGCVLVCVNEFADVDGGGRKRGRVCSRVRKVSGKKAAYVVTGVRRVKVKFWVG